MSSQAAEFRPAQGKKPYEAPKLTVFGPLSKLTQAGTGPSNENNGQSRCGPLYQNAGPKTC